MHVEILRDDYRNLWNDFVAKNGGHILQSYEWGKFKGSGSWDPFILVIKESGEIKAGISIISREIPVFGLKLFYAPRGPVVDFNNPEIVRDLFDAVKAEAKKRGAVALRIDPEIKEEEALIINMLNSFGLVYNKRQIQPRATFMVDLTRNIDDILSSFEEKTRYNVRLAEKKGVHIKQESNINGIEHFYRMYLETSQRDNFMIHPKEYYYKLKEYLIDKGLAEIFVAYFRSVPVASVVVFRFADKVWYMYGASVGIYRNVMPNHLLHWHIMKWAKEKGYKYYDLWGIPAKPKEGHPLYGVYRFKKGFNGEQMKWIGVYDLPFDKFLYWSVNTAIKIYQNIRSLLTKGKISDSLAE